jgi:hypothetical protein
VEKFIVLAFFSVVAINQICPQKRAKIKRKILLPNYFKRTSGQSLTKKILTQVIG